MNETLTKNTLKEMSSPVLASQLKEHVWGDMDGETVESDIVEEAINRLKKESDDISNPGLLICNDSDCEVRKYCEHAVPHFENEECQFVCDAELPCAVCQPVEVAT